MKKLILILTITISLFAQYEWSAPIQLSRDGVWPELMIGYPSITMDNNGILHAFWVISQEINGDWTNGWYSQVEYRKSTDSGLSWSATENLTPEYTTDRIYVTEAICDQSNNVHLLYSRSPGPPHKMYYMKYDGSSWSEPIIMSDLSGGYARMHMDSSGRIYCLWYVVNTSYYSYLDSNDSLSTWSNPLPIHDTIDYTISDFVFDSNDILHAVGTHGYFTDYRPYYYQYDKSIEEWTVIDSIDGYDEKSLGRAIAISNDDSLIINISVGQTLDNNIDTFHDRFIYDSTWSDLFEYGGNNRWEREMYIDNYNTLHLFTKHYYEGSTDGDIGLGHTKNKDGVWTVESIDSLHNFSYSDPNIAFDKVSDKFNLIYQKYDDVNDIMRIYFQTKNIDTKIMENGEWEIENYSLEQNYPNPFNPSTTIEFSIPQNQQVILSVYNIKGELVDNLFDKKMKKGKHKIMYNATGLNSGIYFYTLNTEENEITKKMIFIK